MEFLRKGVQDRIKGLLSVSTTFVALRRIITTENVLDTRPGTLTAAGMEIKKN
jgi:hypothetical protein